MDDEMLADLLAQAILKSACAQAQCRVSAEVHKWFVYVVHLDDHAHTCAGCDWKNGYPWRLISNESLCMSDRGVLVADLSRWLSHLHASQDAIPSGSGGGGGGAPIDGDAPASTPGGGLRGDDGSSGDSSARDRVGSRPRD